MIIHNVVNYLTVDTVLHPTRPESSRWYSLGCSPENLTLHTFSVRTADLWTFCYVVGRNMHSSYRLQQLSIKYSHFLCY